MIQEVLTVHKGLCQAMHNNLCKQPQLLSMYMYAILIVDVTDSGSINCHVVCSTPMPIAVNTLQMHSPYQLLMTSQAIYMYAFLSIVTEIACWINASIRVCICKSIFCRTQDLEVVLEKLRKLLLLDEV